MSGNSIHAIEGLRTRLGAVRDATTRLTALRDRVALDLKTRRLEVEELTRKITLLSSVSELFRHLMDALVGKQVQNIESIVTEGFHSIFHDLDLKFEADVATKNNKISIEFFIRQGSGDLSYRGKPLESFGGGPSSVASLLLRILAITKLKRAKILILDESLVAVSDEYVNSVGRFLSTLAQEMEIDILLVTHNQSFLEHAQRSYRCAEVVDGEQRQLSLSRNR